MPDVMNRPLRKSHKQVFESAAAQDILDRGQVLRLAMCSGDQPYLVPLNYVHDQGRIYLHTGRQGLKMEFLRANPKVCFEVTVDVELLPSALPCKWNCAFRSVLGFGRVVEVEDPSERRRGLEMIVTRYAGPGPHRPAAEAAERVCVLRLDIESLTCKHNLP